MSMATTLLKADHLGVRDLKGHLSVKMLSNPLVITDRGVPISVNLPYSDALELMDLLDELEDPQTLAAVSEGRKAINAGAKGIPASRLFGRIMAKRR